MMVSLGGGQLLHEAGVLPDGPQYEGVVMRAGQAGQPGDLGQHSLAVCGIEKGLGILDWYQARWRSNRVRAGQASAWLMAQRARDPGGQSVHGGMVGRGREVSKSLWSIGRMKVFGYSCAPGRLRYLVR
ncbi:hypothetical protein M911_02175 [Ectothiorhodospira haloalkaliphila]|uniref:Uncharacterized protein n=1 Tax=Ectothiorhodospira haloalkaliphila TaxID=421628 RepID=W8KYF8_9GAMM|nr:hypothetical protein M911_02175 [Ectothiorhodospira haloalkaliphila]